METIERTAERRIIGTDFAAVIANELIGRSRWFECEPQPFDRWAIRVRDEWASELDASLQRHGVLLATPYLDALAENTEGLSHISPGPASSCQECRSIYDLAADDPKWEEVCDEGNFSQTSCDLCGSGLAGNRYVFHASGCETLHLAGCVDCLEYFANGNEPEA